MKTKDSMKLSFISLTQRGVRSGLTVLGIVIGIAALISLVGVGQGATRSIESQFDALGADEEAVLAALESEEEAEEKLAYEDEIRGAIKTGHRGLRGLTGKKREAELRKLGKEVPGGL